MSQPIPDLWPEIRPATQTAPVAILREQADRLAEKTVGLVEGEVNTASIPPVAPLSRGDSVVYLSSIGEAHEIRKAIAPKDASLVHSLYLKVPSLDNYRCLLVTVIHGRQYYPLSISYALTDQQVRADSENEFLQFLKQFLSDKATKDLIEALMAQVPTAKQS